MNRKLDQLEAAGTPEAEHEALVDLRATVDAHIEAMETAVYPALNHDGARHLDTLHAEHRHIREQLHLLEPHPGAGTWRRETRATRGAQRSAPGP